MKKINIFVVIFVIAILMSIGVLSQLSPIVDIISKVNQITPTISLEEKEICTTKFYDEVEEIYGDCLYYHNYTDCINSSGPNTDCSSKQQTWDFKCKTGEITTNKKRVECEPDSNFIITIDDGKALAKKQIDYSDFGPCVYEEQNNCLIVTCQSKYDGANDGTFHGCKSGTSCQRFEICDDGIKTLYKNSGEDFVEEDPTFYLDKLNVKEVSE